VPYDPSSILLTDRVAVVTGAALWCSVQYV